MADNVTTQATTPATLSSGVNLATRLVSYGAGTAEISPVGIVVFHGSAGSKTVYDLGAHGSYHVVSAASINAVNIVATAGILLSVRVFNNNTTAYPVFVKVYDKATTPAPGTDSASLILTVAAQAGVARDAIMAFGGRFFALGLGIAIVKGIADNDATAVAASDCVVDIEYAQAAN
jgi:hypothetical protein